LVKIARPKEGPDRFGKRGGGSISTKSKETCDNKNKTQKANTGKT